MLQEGPVWFLVADGRRARVLVEARRGAVLAEPAEWAMEIAPEELYESQDRPPRAHDRFGPGRHAIEKRDLHEAEEENFLKRVAARITEAEKHGAFAHLAIAAPPRALGRLRSLLPQAVMQRLRADLDKDVVDEDAAALRERLQELLRR